MADVSKLQIGSNGTVYTIRDDSAVHTVDSSLSSSSANPVQNKVITTELDKKENVVNLGTLSLSSFGKDSYSVSGISASNVATLNAMSAPYDVAFSATVGLSTINFCGTYSGDESINHGTYHIYVGEINDSYNDTKSFTFGVLSSGTTGLLYLMKYAQLSDLATVATTGDYDDLTNKPAVVSTYSPTGTDAVNGTAVAAALATLPTPMQFIGTVGTGGTVEWANLPSASPSNEGFTYKVITDHSTAPTCKVGDTIISNGSSWVVIPSGDEPSGTVTNVAIANGGGLTVSGSPITSSGTITIAHDDTSSQASVSNTGRTYIQSVTLDTYGHVTALSSGTETVTDTTYTFADGTNGFTVTPSGGTAQTVTVTPSITNNVTGSGTNTHVPRWTGTNTIGDTTVVIDNNNNIVSPKAIVLSGVSGSIGSSDSKIYFGSSTSNYYSYLSSNTSGAFSFGASGGGAITVYPNTGTYNCMMTNCGSDLGRNDSDGSKAWKDLYLKGGIYKYSGGTHYKQELQNKAGTIALTSDIPSAPGTLNTTATTAQATNASESLSGSVTLHKIAKTGDYDDLLNKPTIPTDYSDVGAQQEPLVGQAYDSTLDNYLAPLAVATAIVNNRQVFVTYSTPNNGTWYFTSWNYLNNLGDGVLLVISSAFANGQTVSLVGFGTAWQLVESSIPTQTSDLTNDGSDGTSTYVEADEFTTVTASKATAGTAVSCYKSGGVVSQTSYTSGVGFTVAEGTVTATSVYTGGGTVSQTSYSSESITPYTFADVTALAWAT